MTSAIATLRRGTLLFWAGWLTVVTATNVLDSLKTLGALPPAFKFVSGNWAWINQTMDPLGVARALQAAMFAGVIVWELAAALFFWRAWLAYRGRRLADEHATLIACGINLALWAAFQILDEVFLAFQPEGVHRMIFVSQIATLVWLSVPASTAEGA